MTSDDIVLFIISILFFAIVVHKHYLIAIKRYYPVYSPLCTIFGPVYGEKARRSSIVHEWIHMVTLTPYVLLLSTCFGWIAYRYYLGVPAICSFILGILSAHFAVRMLSEAICDAVCIVIIGYRRYWRDITIEIVRFTRYHGLNRLQLLTILLTYPWRIFVIVKGIKVAKRIKNKMQKEYTGYVTGILEEQNPFVLVDGTYVVRDMPIVSSGQGI